MARPARMAEGGWVYHVLNRGNGRMQIFHKDQYFAAFVKLLEEGRKLTGIRILAFCLMHNHWHLLLWPRHDKQLSKFVGWISTTHVRRWRAHRKTEGEGHLYQGRFKSFIVQEDEHLLRVMAYIENNPLRAGMVRQIEDWAWSSAGKANSIQMDEGPVEVRGRGKKKLSQEELDRVRESIKRGRPYGDEAWV